MNMLCLIMLDIRITRVMGGSVYWFVPVVVGD